MNIDKIAILIKKATLEAEKDRYLSCRAMISLSHSMNS